ncbi:MAG: hypothetical protein K5898_01100 [Ruminococcus sp.]|uniref:hypothetical protein n=1 Tax=Ruminococcus sp. TaxID=41978 RepID=UPI0025D8BE45|nr:hypothetical protein [Ruminococcus sp.]MCR4793779.1 hypothetical protein [Ruminococcus sp.]
MEVKTNPFYELRDRLYASAAAGCSLISEDFRLKRAIEGFQPMSEANKVFAKLYAMCNSLLTADDKASAIADCIALADALAVTQGTFTDSSKTAPAAPLKGIRPAHLSLKTINEYKELIRKNAYTPQEFDDKFYQNASDPRILSAILNAADKPYMNKLITALESVMGDDLMPMLLSSIDFSKKNSSGNQIMLVSYFTQDKYNDRFTELAENSKAPMEVRCEAIKAMSFSPANEEQLITMYQTSKGKLKSAAMFALAKIGSPIADKYITEMPKDDKNIDLELLTAASGQAASEYICKAQKQHLIYGGKLADFSSDYTPYSLRLLANKKNVISAFEMWGKYLSENSSNSSNGLIQSFNLIKSLNAPLTANICTHNDKEYRDMIRELYAKYPDVYSLAASTLALIESPETACSELRGKNLLSDIALCAQINFHLTPDGWYRYRSHNASQYSSCNSLRLFRSIPDDMIKFLTDTNSIYNDEDMDSIFRHHCEKTAACENMEWRCLTLSFILGNCKRSDYDRLIDSANKYVWLVHRNHPNHTSLDYLIKFSDKPLNGVLYKYIYNSLKYRNDIISDRRIININIAPDIKVSDMERLIADLTAKPIQHSDEQIKFLNEAIRKIKK